MAVDKEAIRVIFLTSVQMGVKLTEKKIVKYLFFSSMFSTSSVCLSKTSNGFEISSRFVILWVFE